jgi:glycerol-3-phosphate acyltransferase PlsY
MDWIVIASALLGYLSGSVPFGLLLTRWAGLGDVRAIGSGNIGATNVLRTGSKKIAALTLLADALKATLPVSLALLWGSESAAIAAAIGAFLGHLYPVWLGFKGGKGVATFLGVLLALCPFASFAFIALWLATAAVFRFSSLAAIIAVVTAVITASLVSPPTIATAIALMGGLVLLRHRENMTRLWRGQESRISLGRKG